jgi:hypothetical protein
MSGEDDEQEELLSGLGSKSEGEKSEGVITRLADFDMNIAQRYLRKNFNPILDNESEAAGDWDEVSAASILDFQRQDQLEELLNRDIRGGDLSPYRKFSSQIRARKQSEHDPKMRNNNKSTPLQFWSSMKRHKKSMMTTRAKDNGLPVINDIEQSNSNMPKRVDGFSSYISPEESVRLKVPFNQIDDDDDEEEAEKKLRAPNIKDKSKSMKDVSAKMKNDPKKKITRNRRENYKKKLSTLHEADEEKEKESDPGDSDSNSKKFGDSLKPEDTKLTKKSKSQFIPRFSNTE